MREPSRVLTVRSMAEGRKIKGGRDEDNNELLRLGEDDSHTILIDGSQGDPIIPDSDPPAWVKPAGQNDDPPDLLSASPIVEPLDLLSSCQLGNDQTRPLGQLTPLSCHTPPTVVDIPKEGQSRDRASST